MTGRVGGARRDRTDDLKLAKLALSQLSYGPNPQIHHTSSCETAPDALVGLERFELSTSRLSSARSNQLSYKPLTLILDKDRVLACAHRLTPMHRTSAALARVRPRRKRNEDGEIPPMELNNPETVGP